MPACQPRWRMIKDVCFSPIRSFIFQETKKPVRRVNAFIQVRHHPLLLPMLDPSVRPGAGWRAHVLAAETHPVRAWPIFKCSSRSIILAASTRSIWHRILRSPSRTPMPICTGTFQAGSREDFLVRLHCCPRSELRWPFHRQPSRDNQVVPGMIPSGERRVGGSQRLARHTQRMFSQDELRNFTITQSVRISRSPHLEQPHQSSSQPGARLRH
jgi:hypothetical protein